MHLSHGILNTNTKSKINTYKGDDYMAELTKIDFKDANSRDTYFTVHNIKEAHKLSRGKGIKVGIIDWCFAMDENKWLYSGGIDLTGVPKELYEYDGHGLMMATVLREIAPCAEIYAINAIDYEQGRTIEAQNEKRSEYLIKAFDWAIENKIDILTYSHEKFPIKLRDKVDDAIKKVVESGIITTFIHCDSEYNIYPYGCFEFHNNGEFRREPDINIYHFDYNTLFVEQFEKYDSAMRKGELIKSGNDIPYFSFSSMSPVLAGFVALLKGLNNHLTSYECKDILIKTSYEITDKGQNWYDINPCPRVVDIGRAVRYLLSKN